METSMVFDNDLVTCFTKINTEVVSRLRYAYYLTDAFAISFDDSKVGKPCSGNWLITNNTIIVNGRENVKIRVISVICGYYNDLRNMNYVIHVSQVITAARQPESMWKLNSVM